MSSQKSIQGRVISACQQILLHQKYVNLSEVLKVIGLLQPIHEDNWRKGKIQCLEMMIQGNPNKISETITCFREWASNNALTPMKIISYAHTSGEKRPLQYSEDGNTEIESVFQTYYFSQDLTIQELCKLKDKLEEEPELVVFWTVSDFSCSKCKEELQKGRFLLMEGENSLCLNCVALDHLVFLPQGNPKLTRRANKYSSKSVVVVRFSKSRKRYERQGILVEPEALQKAESEVI